MKKINLLLFLFLGLGTGFVLSQVIIPESRDVDLGFIRPANDRGRSEIAVIQEKTPGKPVSISIPNLGLVDVPVEHVGLDMDGKMDVPSNDDNTAWFELGYVPGAKGSAVIAAHYDKSSGEPAVFYNLNSLVPGDLIYLEGDDGEDRVFEVKEKGLYPYDDFPSESVFGKSDKRMLNLITCDGTWDYLSNNYSNRLVVFSELIE